MSRRAAATAACRLLLRAGADVDRRVAAAYDGRTPLHRAAAEGHARLCEFLVEDADANTRLRNAQGYSALGLAKYRGRREAAAYLESVAAPP